jgi:hypothetical protein
MADEIIRELWATKDAIARECGGDLDALVARLQARRRDGDRPVVDLKALKRAAGRGADGGRRGGAGRKG